jgi:hypothetical protein
MKNNSESRGDSNTQDRGNISQANKDQSRMKSGQEQTGAHGSGSGSSSSSSGQPGSSRENEQSPIQHTNAGNTGTGSGQISPITHNQQVPSKTPGGPQSGQSGTDRDR